MCGGLGNQMFQYAAALNLAIRNKSMPKADLSWFYLSHERMGLTPRNFELNQFEGIEVNTVNLSQLYRMALRVIRRIPLIRESVFCRKRIMIEQKLFQYDTQFEELENDAILDGYFQALGYLEPVAHILRKSFVPKSKDDQLYNSILTMANSEDTVAIHVRRGDYVSNPSAAIAHGAQDSGYYRKAINLVSERVRFPKLLFFSDDLEWCKSTFRDIADAYFMDTQHLNSAQVLYLMSQCNHQIISNSSFSWWSGWLNARNGKCVYMPKNWMEGIATSDTELVFESCIIVF
jgi:hypothetical protein